MTEFDQEEAKLQLQRNGIESPTSEQICMEFIRKTRNALLSETDWWVLPDRTASQEQKDYRQALRDLPSTASPTLDEQGNLTNVTWPTKPE